MGCQNFLYLLFSFSSLGKEKNVLYCHISREAELVISFDSNKREINIQ